MGKSTKNPPAHISSQPHINSMLDFAGIDLICNVCDSEVTAMSIIGYNRFINAHFHGMNVQPYLIIAGVNDEAPTFP